MKETRFIVGKNDERKKRKPKANGIPLFLPVLWLYCTPRVFGCWPHFATPKLR